MLCWAQALLCCAALCSNTESKQRKQTHGTALKLLPSGAFPVEASPAFPTGKRGLEATTWPAETDNWYQKPTNYELQQDHWVMLSAAPAPHSITETLHLRMLSLYKLLLSLPAVMHYPITQVCSQGAQPLLSLLATCSTRGCFILTFASPPAPVLLGVKGELGFIIRL